MKKRKDLLDASKERSLPPPDNRFRNDANSNLQTSSPPSRSSVLKELRNKI